MKATRQHFGIIPDGGRRWSKREMRSLTDAYCECVSRIVKLAEMARLAGYDEVSVYCLSAANLERSEEEVAAVFDIMRAALHRFEPLVKPDRFQALRVIGETQRLPSDLRQRLQRLEEISTEPAGSRLNLLFAYDPWAELQRAHRRAGERPLQYSDFDVESPLHVVFRSGSGVLLSGFLPFQSQYAHLIVSERLFNDFSDDDFRAVLEGADRLDHLTGC